MNTDTLKDKIVAAHCRKNAPHNVTKHGAYWLAVEPPLIHSYGGDGVGNNNSDIRNYLELQHYRDGTVRCVVVRELWHQNRGTSRDVCHVAALNNCTSVEDVIVALLQGDRLGESFIGEGEAFRENLTNVLHGIPGVGLDLPIRDPSPDELGLA